MNHENGGVSSPSNDQRPQGPAASDEAKSALQASVVAGARHLADGAKQAGVDVAAGAKSTAEKRLSGGKERAAESLGSVAAALRQTGETLRNEDAGGLTDYVVKAADRIEAASGYLKERDLKDVVTDVSNFARREPALFLGGAFILGLAGGRFLKSSHREASAGAAPASLSPPRGRAPGMA
jgi:hypothetical protein